VSEGLTGETGIRTQAGVIGAPHGEDFKATLCFLAAFALVGLVWAEDAVAVNLTSPSAGAATSSTPTFTWQLGPGEESSTIEISPTPRLGRWRIRQRRAARHRYPRRGTDQLHDRQRQSAL
jgi:hypothetical protein